MLVDELLGVLKHQPGLTAQEAFEALRDSRPARATGWPVKAVSLALHESGSLFVSDRADPPRWWVASSRAPTASMAPRRPAGAARGADEGAALPQLFPWQADALAAWHGSGCRGVVEAVTGAGKTVLGLSAALEELERRGQVLVVVPTVELMHQWRERVARLLAPGYSVGCLGDGRAATLLDDDVVVAVVNSLRATDSRHTRQGGLLVADECHRYGSAVNRLVLDGRFERRLGLSATYVREDGGHVSWLEPYFGGTCFQLGYRRAVDEGATARFALALVGVQLKEAERDEYVALTEEIRVRHARLLRRFDLPVEPPGAFLRAVIALASGEGDQEGRSGEARAYLALLLERRRLLADTASKPEALANLAPALATANRSIVFTRSIATALGSTEVLTSCGLRAGVIHSRLRPADRRAVLARFAKREIDVIAAPHVLDEGVDVPEADMAVIVAASRSRRQMIQRMGRVLRRKSDGRRARVAVLFAEGTVEDPECGAQEGFLEEITSVADEVHLFGASRGGTATEAARWLGTP
ncbi:MAG: DEAD/DEAH box helicase, partial [Acidimicrobiales bacterium]